MSSTVQPSLACPSCGYSLRGQLPLGPAQVLRCPECGGITSIAHIIRDHERRQRNIGRIIVVALIAAVLVVAFSLFRQSSNFASARIDTSFMAFGFFLGAGMSALVSALWDHPPRHLRYTFIIGGGGLLAAAASVSPALVIIAHVWWFAWQAWASKRGYI